MDFKQKTEKILLLDTETIGLEKRFIYDIGYIVMERLPNGQYQALESGRYIIKNVYENKELFATAYYSEKKPLYTNALKGRKVKKHKVGHTMQSLKYLIQRHNIKFFTAYNSPFDKGAFKFTCEFYKLQNPLKGVSMLDAQGLASVIHESEDYKAVAIANGWRTPKGYIRTNAECTYKYISGDYDFVEQHTGLEDCVIELAIINHSLKLGGWWNNKKRTFIRA